MKKINYYISSHGFGHSTRAIEVINHIPESMDVEIITKAPQWLFDRSVKRSFRYRALHHDPGILQVNSLENDIGKTYDCWSGLLDRYPAMAEEEAQRIVDNHVDLSAGDISPFAIAAAQKAGIPSVIIANFSWDWIFSVFLDKKPEFQQVIDRISDYYKKAEILYRTPMAGDLSVFPIIEDIPLIVRRSNKSREQARSEFGLEPDGKVVLISFGGMGLANIEPQYLEPFLDITFLTFDEKLLGPANVRYLHPQETYHPDAIQASDLALAKMGYGIVTECIAHQTPIAYPPRNDFPEQAVLEREASQWIETYPIDENDFYSGNWDFLERICKEKERELITDISLPPLDGGKLVANKLFRLLDLRSDRTLVDQGCGRK